MPRGVREPIEVRFWRNVEKSGSCWVWTGKIGWGGYGTLSVNKSTVSAHKLSYLLNVGPIEDGLWVLHRCDNPLCVRPEHLFLGTRSDNMKDAFRKGRAALVSPLGPPVTEEKREQIKRDLASHQYSQVELCKRYGVSKATIYNIKKESSLAK